MKRDKVALIKTDYEKERLQPTSAGHLKGKLLSTGFSYKQARISWDVRGSMPPNLFSRLNGWPVVGKPQKRFCILVTKDFPSRQSTTH
jgi:hypothetical protein